MRYSYKHDRISALAALSVSSVRKHMGLFVQFRQVNFRDRHVARFVRALLQHLRGQVILLLDSASIHKGPEIRFLQENYPRLHLEYFPTYAPELNPVEHIWREFKSRTANSLPVNKQDIRLQLHGNTRYVRRSQARLRAFVRAADLPSLF